MLCRQSTHIFLKILKILQMQCESCIEDSAKIREGDCNVPKVEPCCKSYL
jgi:hypothetical protein